MVVDITQFHLAEIGIVIKAKFVILLISPISLLFFCKFDFPGGPLRSWCGMIVKVYSVDIYGMNMRVTT